jgi:hypothetical protein
VFPELRKAREERERFNRLGARVKSEAELEELADGLHEQEHEDKKMRALTVVPPLLPDPAAAAPVYTDTNRQYPCLQHLTLPHTHYTIPTPTVSNDAAASTRLAHIHYTTPTLTVSTKRFSMFPTATYRLPCRVVTGTK